MNALTKVDVPLSERYETKCCECGWDRHFYGTKTEARASAEKMGWEFRKLSQFLKLMVGTYADERAYCPHCKLLVKNDAPVAQFRAPGS